MMSFLTYITGFFMNFEFLPILTNSAVAAILVGVLKCGTQFWKRTTQESFQQSLVEIGSIVSEENIFS
jgi:Mg2+ and Co2+ transporter CorA